MNSLMCLLLIFASISSSSAYTCQKICVFENVTCVTRGGIDLYKNLVYGVKGLIKPLDPLHIEKIHGVMESVKYELTNITMTGLKTCYVTQAELNSTVNIYKQYLHCPKLRSTFHFKAKEDSDYPMLRGRGIAEVTAYNYDILNFGKYSVFVNTDHKPHFFKKTHQSRINLKGKLEFTIKKAYITDSHKVNETEKYMNEHWRETEEILHKPILTSAMEILIDHMDIYVRNFTMGEVIPEHRSKHKINC